MSVDQFVIMLTGVLAAWLNQDPREHVRRWACIVGLIGQPFWAYAGWKAGQWGMLAVTVGFTVAYLRGVLSTWLPGPSKREFAKHVDCPPACDICEGDPYFPLPCARLAAARSASKREAQQALDRAKGNSCG